MLYYHYNLLGSSKGEIGCLSVCSTFLSFPLPASSVGKEWGGRVRKTGQNTNPKLVVVFAMYSHN